MKKGGHVRPSCRSAESSNIFTGKCLWWRLFFIKDASLEFIPAISLKRNSNTEVFPYGFFTVTLFKLSEIIFCEMSLQKNFWQSRRLPIYRLQLTSNNVFDKKYLELAFNSKGYLYCVKNYIYIGIPMPMPIPMLRCRCRDFQMAPIFSKIDQTDLIKQKWVKFCCILYQIYSIQ